MWLAIDISLGVAVGLLYAWAWAAWEAHRKFKRLNPGRWPPLTLLASRIVSILLVVIMTFVSNVLIRFQLTWLNIFAWTGCVVMVAAGTWKLVLKPRIMR